ncbi:metal ABC transporter permease [Mycolicibacterium gilvum]|uniref:ABC-type Mn2+/Zn2+ transport system, permease component n=1 Tax=Mycolicibacterium gilvum (strain DSM 45189 / LMG 24558 / Spyr1) TaxID=278137 RepID=E6TJ47_MYCSR|nr:metal ABC transporter permease [Mycolicibacterium gilvum]ADT99124.1 ABC-type Mn2+/Zn2+ transport system, permease component [Mycolicibacterium gilvum Spyr1]
MTVVEFLVEPLQLEFMVRATVTTLIASTVCATLSCWLVLIGWSLMGDAVSHAVLPGVVLAHIVGAPFALGAIIFGFVAVGLIGVVRDTSRTKEDAAIGVVFTTLFALGLVLISVTPSQVDLNHIIFGNVLGVSRADLIQVAVLGTVVMAVMVYKRRDFTLYAFDPHHAHAIGLNPRLLGAALLGLLALTAVVALQAVGVVLVVALLITPGATAYLITERFSRMLLIAPTIAAVCALTGLYASYYLDTASGPMVVLANGTAFALAYLARLGREQRTRHHRPGVRAPWTETPAAEDASDCRRSRRAGLPRRCGRRP